MAPPKAQNAVNPPDTLPSDFFDKQGGSAPDSLPGNFFDQQDTSPPQPSQGNFLQQAVREHMQSRPYSTDQGILGNIGTAGRNLGAGALSAIAGGGGDWPVPLGSLTHPERPLPKPQEQRSAFLPQSGESFGDYLGRAGGEATKLAGNIGTTLALGKGTGAATEGIANLRDPVRAYRSPLIPENEAIARAATDVIKPNPLEYNRTVQNLTSQLPQAKEFLQRSGINKPSSPLEFGKGATGAGKEASGFLQENLIKPNAEAPAGGGTVNSVYSRLSDINDKLRPIYRARSMGEQMTKEAQDNMANLEAERDKLNGVLYKTLSQRSGLPEEQIQNINQRGAQLQSVGDITDAAQAVRRMGLTHSPGGMLVPMGGMERALRVLDYLRGGPEAVAGRKLGRIMGQVNEPSTPLPNPEDIANHRLNFQSQEQDAAAANRMASAARKPEGLAPTQYPGRLTYDPVEQQQILQQRGARAATRSEGITQNAAEQRAEALVKAQRDAELLAKARQTQEAARTLRKPQ